MRLTTNNPKETQKVAANLAEKFIKKGNKKTLIIALEGELGSGKTTFIKGFSKALGVREKILSPTFVLIHKHEIASSKPSSRAQVKGKRITNNNFKNLYHIDAYRLNSGKDLLKLGVKEIFDNPENIVLIEWADRTKKAIPKNAIWIHFDHLDKNKRRITTE